MRYFSTLVLTGAALCHAVITTERAQAPCTGPNLIKNGGFEAHPNSIKPWSNSKAHILKPGSKSKQAVGVSSLKQSTYSEITQEFGDCSSTKNYLVTWDQYLESPVFGPYESSGTIPILGEIQALISTTAKNNATWQSYKQVAPATSGGYRIIDYVIASTPPGTAKIDNVVVQPFPAYTVEADAPNHIKNGGFESGSLGPWKAADKDNLCKLQKPGIGSTSGHSYQCFSKEEAYSSLFQDISTTPGQLYEFSFDYKIVARGRQWYCSISINIGEWQYAGTSVIVGGLEGVIDNGRLLHYSVPFIADKAQNTVHLEFDGAYGGLKARADAIGGTDTCKFQLDNVSFKPANTNG